MIGLLVKQCQKKLVDVQGFCYGGLLFVNRPPKDFFLRSTNKIRLNPTQKNFTRYILLTVVGGSPQVSFLKSKVIKKFNLVIKIRLVR